MTGGSGRKMGNEEGREMEVTSFTTMQLRSSPSTGMAVVVPLSWDERAPGNSIVGDGASIVRNGDGPGRVSELETSSDFDFSAGYSETLDGAPFSLTEMSPADELFHNGQIRPLRPAKYQHQLSLKQLRSTSSDDESSFCARRSSNCSASAPESPRCGGKQHEKKLRSGGPVRFPLPLMVTLEPKRAAAQPEGADQSMERLRKRRQQMRPARLDVARSVPHSARESTIERNPFLSPLYQQKTKQRDGSMSTGSLSPVSVHLYRGDKASRARPWYEQSILSDRSEDFYSSNSLITDPSEQCRDPKQTEAPKRAKRWKLSDMFRFIDDRIYSRQNSRNFTASPTSLTCSASEKKSLSTSSSVANSPMSGNSTGHAKRVVSPHAIHYERHKEQARQMRNKTFLPYRQNLLAFLNFHPKVSCCSEANVDEMQPV